MRGRFDDAIEAQQATALAEGQLGSVRLLQLGVIC